MPETPFVDVYVKAVAITRGDAILLVYNENWGAFTLPMSKPRLKPDERNPSQPIEEKAQDTAIRVVVEAIGRPLEEAELPIVHGAQIVETYDQSLRDGVWKCYHTELFKFELGASDTPRPLGGVPMAWMTLDEVGKLRPVSPTARAIAQAMLSTKSGG